MPMETRHGCCLGRNGNGGCHIPFFSRIVLVMILLVWFLVASLTSYVLLQRNYSTSNNGKDVNTWVMLGGLTSTSVNFRIRNSNHNNQNDNDDVMAMRLVVAHDPDLTERVFEQDVVGGQENFAADMVLHSTATDLVPNTQYHYAVLATTASALSTEESSVLTRGQFQTAPIEGQAINFKIVASACAWTGSNAMVFETLQLQQLSSEEEGDAALFFLHLGDFHYGDLTTDSVAERVWMIDNVMSSHRQRALWGHVPLAYMWDDHDWLDNNSGGDPTQPGFEAALQSYQIALPYYEPLPSVEWNRINNQNRTSLPTTTNTTVGMYQAFTIGTVRFIVTDLRSEASDEHVYSSIQRDWFFRELEMSDQYDFVVWANTRPWIGEAKEDSDTWAGYAEDRQELSDHIQRVVTKQNLLVISADAHMIGFDDGSHTYYGEATSEETEATHSTIRSFPILQTGPLDRLGSIKGGPYSDGCQTYEFERNHQYSVIEFHLEREREGEACIVIKSYADRGVVFEKELCGPSLFGNARSVDELVGTCTEVYFSTVNTVLLCISGFLLLVAMVLTLFIFKGCCAALGTSCLILIIFALTYVTGFFIPAVSGTKQIDAFEIILICVLQIFSVVCYLIAWRCYRTNRENEGKCMEGKAFEDSLDTEVR